MYYIEYYPSEDKPLAPEVNQESYDAAFKLPKKKEKRNKKKKILEKQQLNN